ncbi:MAG: hypothetical protein KJ011_11320 [Burkholderiaceae bacterium]|nr:hypothetical protein [Burkholderiaceae bacterium]
MKLSTYLSIAGIIGLAFGLVFLLAPQFALTQYGVPTEAHNLLQMRYFGSTLAALSLVVWLARGVRDETAIHAVLIGSAAGFAVGVLLSLWGVMSGLINALGWSSVVIYLLLLLGALYFLMPARKPLAA